LPGAPAQGHKGAGSRQHEGRPVSIDAAEVKRLSNEIGPAAITKRLGIARSGVYRVGA